MLIELLITIRLALEAGKEGFKFLQTPQGQAWLELALKNHVTTVKWFDAEIAKIEAAIKELTKDDGQTK